MLSTIASLKVKVSLINCLNMVNSLTSKMDNRDKKACVQNRVLGVQSFYGDHKPGHTGNEHTNTIVRTCYHYYMFRITVEAA